MARSLNVSRPSALSREQLTDMILQPQTTSGGIPKVIHQIWIGGQIPELQQEYMETFMHMPGWRYKLWGNADLTELNFPRTWKYIVSIIAKPKTIWAQIADLMRLELLYIHGGVYVDCTAESVKPFGDLLDKGSLIMSNEQPCGLDCVGQRGLRFISNSFIAAAPRHHVLKRLLRKLKHIDFDEPANLSTGPYFVRTGIVDSSDVRMLPTKLIYPVHGDLVEPDRCISQTPEAGFKSFERQGLYVKIPCREYKDAYMIKHWDVGGSWIKR